MLAAPFLIAVLVFSATMLFAVALLVHLGYVRGHQTLVEKIRKTGDEYLTEETAETHLFPSSPALKRKWLDVITRIGDVFKPKETESITQVQKLFLRAGYHDKNATVLFFGLKVVCAAALLVLVFALHMLSPGHVKVLNVSLFCIGFAMLGFYLPNLWLSYKIARRQEMLTVGLPDALDLLVVCAEAGMGLDGAMKRVGEEMRLNNKAISEEFRLLNLEMKAGKTRKDALKNLAMRTGLDEMSSLITLLIQTDRFGTSVAQALRVQSEAIRTRRTQSVEELAAKLPIKLLFPTIFCIFPSLFLVILGPALLQAFRNWNN